MRGLMVGLLACVVAFGALAAGMAPKKAMTSQEALRTLELATGDFKGTRNEHVLIQDALKTLAAVTLAYEQYVSAPTVTPEAGAKKKSGK